MLGPEDLTHIQVLYGIPGEFVLELSHSNARANSPPPGQLGVYENAFQTGLRSPISPFVLELFMFYGISLCTLSQILLGLF